MSDTDINGTEENKSGATKTKSRQKPGPKKKDAPRSEKISCRLTDEEKARGEAYCKTHGINEAKLLRASYLAAISEPPTERMKRFIDVLMKPLDEENLSPVQKQTIKTKTMKIMRNSVMLLALTLIGYATAPIVVKGILFLYDTGKSLLYDGKTSCLYRQDMDGCEIITNDPEK